MNFYFPIPEKEVKSKIEYNCEKCKLYKRKISTPYFFPTIGDKYNGLVILGENPSGEDDEKGRPFINKRASVIRSIAFRNKVNLAKEAAFVYALACCAGKMGTGGTDVQFKCCRSILEGHLKELKPKFIICCGEMAFKSLFDLKNKVAISKLRGRIVPNYEFNCMVMSLYNPNDVFQSHYELALRRDMERAISLWNRRYHIRKKVDEELQIKKILDGAQIHEIKTPSQLDLLINWVSQLDEVSVDYETTNVKPYDKWFDITHISFANEKIAYVINESLWQKYPVWHQIKQFMNWLLEEPKIHKIIQNDKFEDLCSRYKFKIKRIVNSDCPMLATHVIDERRGCTSLDFQNLTRFGIPPYSETVKSFLEKKEKDDKQNRIREAPYDDLITYAGLDVITTYYNWKFIELVLPKNYDKAVDNYKFLHKGHRLFANMTHRGVKAGINELNELEKIFEDNIQDVLYQITQIPEFVQYNEYLSKQLILKKEGDKKLESLEKVIKEEINESNLHDGKRKIKKIELLKRKIQF